MKLLLLSLLVGCMTNKKQIDRAKKELVGQCLEQIEIKLKENHCPNIEIYENPGVMVFRCKKPDVSRENIWDTWWFRLTSSIIEWPEADIQEVEEHTVCIDARFRLEAYPPKEE